MEKFQAPGENIIHTSSKGPTQSKISLKWNNFPYKTSFSDMQVSLLNGEKKRKHNGSG